MLQEQAPIEAYTEWLDSMVDRCVVKVSTGSRGQHEVKGSVWGQGIIGHNYRMYSSIYVIFLLFSLFASLMIVGIFVGILYYYAHVYLCVVYLFIYALTCLLTCLRTLFTAITEEGRYST